MIYTKFLKFKTTLTKKLNGILFSLFPIEIFKYLLEIVNSMHKSTKKNTKIGKSNWKNVYINYPIKTTYEKSPIILDSNSNHITNPFVEIKLKLVYRIYLWNDF